MNKEKWLSISELSELLVRGESSIRRQVIKAGLKKNKEGKYKIENVLEVLEQAKERDNNNPRTLSPSKERKYNLECQLLEYKLKLMTGELISREEAIQDSLEVMGIVKRSIVNFPKEVAQIYSGTSAYEGVKKAVENLCNSISEAFRRNYEAQVNEENRVKEQANKLV